MEWASASVSSCATVGLLSDTAEWLSGSVGYFTGASMRDGLLEMRIPQGQQRPLPELKQKHGQPQAANAEGRDQIHPGDSEASFGDSGSDLPEQIHKAHHKDEHGDLNDEG